MALSMNCRRSAIRHFIAQGKTLKLSDVATVERGYEDPPLCRFVTSLNRRCCSVLSCAKAGMAALGKALDAEAAKSMRLCRWG